MIYSCQMSRNIYRKVIGKLISSIITILVYTPLLVLKQTGQLLISTIVYLFTSLFETYKLFIFLIRSLITMPGKIILSLFKIFSRFPGIKSRKKASLNKKVIKPDERKKRREGLKKLKLNLLKFKFFILGSLCIVSLLIYSQINEFITSLPNPDQIIIQGFPATTKIYDRNGILLYEIFESYNRTPIKLTDIPKHVIRATIAAEDKEFYLHNGISLRGITRAILHNFTSESLEGGSTITQQLIRSTFLTPEKTIIRKTKEIILALWTEQIYSKDQILEMYLNQVPYGGTAWGIEAAAQTYFGKKTSELNLLEAAFLAGLPASPSRYSPFSSQIYDYKNRMNDVLKRMLSEKYITEEDYNNSQSFALAIKEPRIPIAAPHFVMHVRDILNKYYGRRLTETGGLRVITSLDLSLQDKVQKIVSDEIENLSPLHVTNGAALVTNPKNGEILAMVGSADYFDRDNEGNVNVTLSLRAPGSAIKVVNFAAALQGGFSAATQINDSAVTYNYEGEVYRPVNYDGKFHGQVTLRRALGSSYNIPAVKILDKIGVPKMIETGKKMGIDSWDNEERYGLSLTLGGGEVTMYDMAEVYGTLANGGKHNNLAAIISISDHSGKKLPIPKEKPIKAIPETVAFILSNILADNEARTPAFGSNSVLYIPGKNIPVKTGTSDNKRDNWTIGYTPDYVTTVWVGNNDNSPMNPKITSGITGAAPIWRQIMDQLNVDYKENKETIPQGIITVKCKGRDEYFIEGQVTENPCKSTFAKIVN